MNDSSGAGATDEADVRIGNDFFPTFTRGEMLARRQRTAAMMAEKGYDALVIWGGFGVVFGSAAGQTNMMWLANYAACMQGYLIVARDGTLTLILRIAHHIHNAKDLTFIDDIRASYSMTDGVADRLRELKTDRGRIGIVGPHLGRPATVMTVPVEHHRALVEALPHAALLDATADYEAVRRVRSREELDVLRRAGKLCDNVFAEMIRETRRGVRATDLRRLVNVRCAEAGATYVFCHIGAAATADPARMYPDYYPTDRAVNAGDVLYTELCLGYGNYWGKIWGTWFCGQPPADYAAMFADAAGMHDRIAAALKPGSKAVDFDRYALELKAKGYDLHYPLLSGWSAINHDPQAGGVAGEKTGNLVAPYRAWEFRAGEPYTLCVWITRAGTERGVWVGTSGAVSESGFERFNTGYPAALPIA